MAKYIDKAALVAEIEKELNTTKKYSTEYVNGKKYALIKILSFLDTLEVKEVEEEPVSKDLEDAAHLYVDTTIEYFDSEGNPCCYSAFIAGAQWQKKQEVKEVDLEKEVHNAADQYDINNNGNIYWEDIVGFAKHFFELGLKAQKGE